MITKMKSICIVFVLSILFVSISDARTVKAVSVSGGEDHSMVLDEYGRVWTCGQYSSGQLGHDENSYFFNLVLKGEQASDSNFLERISGIGAGWKHSLAVGSSGSVWAWGNDDSGQLGNGSEDGNNYPVQVHAGEQNPAHPDYPLRHITAVSAGRSGEHSLAIDANHFCYAWGLNNMGQCGTGTIIPSLYTTPQKVLGGLMGTTYLQYIIAVSAGQDHSMALDANGFVYTFGSNYRGKLGINTTDTRKTTPQKVKGVGGSGYLSDVNSISAGWFHSMALQKYVSGSSTYRGRVYCWGSNGGRLGNGKNADFNSTPVLVLKGEMSTTSGYLEEIKAIGAGEGHCIALDIYGNVWAWGDNYYGQLGTNNTTDSLTPVKVRGQDGIGSLSHIVAISAGYWHNLAIDSNGIIWVWGSGDYGKLGLGYLGPCLTPIALPMLSMEFPSNNADFNNDGIVNFSDFAVIARSWKTSAGADYNDICDLYNDDTIDYKDLYVFCQNWLWSMNSNLDNSISGEGEMMQSPSESEGSSFAFDESGLEESSESLFTESAESTESVEQQQQMFLPDYNYPAVYLTCDNNIPDVNDEVTVYVHSATGLFAMGLGIYVQGDGYITGAMAEADCNEYGWDNGWNSDPYIDPNGWGYLSGVSWGSSADDIVGYMKFRYDGGQISVYIDQVDSIAFAWNETGCPIMPLSQDVLLVGTDPNEP